MPKMPLLDRLYQSMNVFDDKARAKQDRYEATFFERAKETLPETPREMKRLLGRHEGSSILASQEFGGSAKFHARMNMLGMVDSDRPVSKIAWQERPEAQSPARSLEEVVLAVSDKEVSSSFDRKGKVTVAGWRKAVEEGKPLDPKVMTIGLERLSDSAYKRSAYEDGQDKISSLLAHAALDSRDNLVAQRTRQADLSQSKTQDDQR